MKGKRIYLTEEQFNEFLVFLNEGVDWGKDDNGNRTLSINKSTLDKDNMGKNSVDTRVFGTRNDILYGDGTKKIGSLSDSVLSKRAMRTTAKNIIAYIKNGRKGPIFTDNNLPDASKKAFLNWLENLNDEEILIKAYNAYNRHDEEGRQKEGVFKRAINAEPDEKIARYTVFTVIGTDVKCIALYRMENFDLSDAIKNGKLRSTSASFGKNLDGYKVNTDTNTVDVKYDDGENPDIKRNFSLNGTLNKDHTKAQYQLQGAKYDTSVNTADDLQKELSKNKTYTSINQFIDKSIIYADYALKKENYWPDVIVSVPSSSKMNFYYSTNLSNKLGVRYIPDFFKRNIVNARLKDGITDEDLIERGFTPIKIEQMKREIKSYAYKEITYNIEKPLRDFINENFETFKRVRTEKYGREGINPSKLLNVLSKYAFKCLDLKFNTGKNDILKEHLFYCFKMKTSAPKYERNILNTAKSIIQTRFKKRFSEILTEMFNLFQYYVNEVRKGYEPGSYGVNGAKITSIKKEYRQFVEGSFIIADENLNENGELFKQLRNSNFLIVDEDINSGTSFKLAIDALCEKLSYDNTNIMCLANGFSESGR